MKKLGITLLMIASLLLLPLMAQATLILVGPSNFTGERYTPTDVIATDGWTEGNGGFKISWTITQVGTGVWNYLYRFTDKDGSTLQPDISHLLLEVSASFTLDNISGANGLVLSPTTYSPPSPSNPFLPGSIYAIKFDFGSGTYSFTSNRAPVWGDFYVKDGKHGGIEAAAWNSGFGTDPTINTTNFGPWVPTPDTTNGVVPEPGTLILLGSGLVGLAGFGKIRRKKKE